MSDTFTLTLPTECDIPVTAVPDAEVLFTLSKCTPHTLLEILIHGAKQIANDANAGKRKAGASDTALIKTVADKLADLENGTHAFGGGGGGERLTPVEREARAIVRAHLIKKGWKAGDADKALPTWRTHVSADAADRVVAKATENVALRDIDLDATDDDEAE